jgi:NCAIR mutase (PurE)-related protein
LSGDSPALPRSDSSRSNSSRPDLSPDQGPASSSQTQWLENAAVDIGRQSRCGFAEAIYGEGKSADLITEIIQAQLDQGQSALVTRLDPGVIESVSKRFQHTRVNPLARTLRVDDQPIVAPPDVTDDQTHVAVVTAGSTDRAVAEEAIETLCWMGIPVRSFCDIGVAGPQRLLASVPRLRQASALVVVAGMEGALPSVVAGHVSAPIFAVPTSVGYGANLGGVTALLGMLVSCAAGVAVVNIDAGFKGAYMAGLVVSQGCRLPQSDSQ